jgi:hypothetical protein
MEEENKKLKEENEKLHKVLDYLINELEWQTASRHSLSTEEILDNAYEMFRNDKREAK